ncbi:MAG: patatin-like phospholipase family protein [Hyphomicrobium sp.]
MTTKILERIGGPAPHRILALDGGGVRGVISIAFLEAIELLLAARAVRLGKVSRAEDFRLSDYFDIIGGTSVGSMLAVLLAQGRRVAEIREQFEDWAPAIFRRPWGRPPYITPKFNAANLQKCVSTALEEETLGSDRFETVVAVIAKRLDTGSSWVMTNSPLSKYWEDDPEHGVIGNQHYRLTDLVCASTAAPFYFAPRRMKIDAQTTGVFVDGGVSPHNSPALQLFMLAGIRGYRFGWDIGADKLLMISVGAGTHRMRLKDSMLNRLIPGALAIDALQGLIADGQTMSLKMLQWLSKPRNSWEINGEVGALENDELFRLAGVEKPLLSFSRYDVRLEHDWLERELSKVVSKGSLELHRAFDNPRNIPANYELARLAAEKQVSDDDFPSDFDGWRRY